MGKMVIFKYRVTPVSTKSGASSRTSFVRVTDEPDNNVVTSWFGKEYRHTISQADVLKIKKIIDGYPGIFEIEEELEPNNISGGNRYAFIFSNGKKTNSFVGFNILDYGSMPRKNATMALRAARQIKECVLWPNGIRTMIPNRLQHWPKNRNWPKLIKI